MSSQVVVTVGKTTSLNSRKRWRIRPICGLVAALRRIICGAPPRETAVLAVSCMISLRHRLIWARRARMLIRATGAGRAVSAIYSSHRCKKILRAWLWPQPSHSSYRRRLWHHPRFSRPPMQSRWNRKITISGINNKAIESLTSPAKAVKPRSTAKCRTLSLQDFSQPPQMWWTKANTTFSRGMRFGTGTTRMIFSHWKWSIGRGIGRVYWNGSAVCWNRARKAR